MNAIRRILNWKILVVILTILMLAACSKEEEPTPTSVVVQPAAMQEVVAEVVAASPTDAPALTDTPAPAATVTLSPDTVLPTNVPADTPTPVEDEPTATPDPFPGSEGYYEVLTPADSGFTGATLFDTPEGEPLGFASNETMLPVYGCNASYCATYDIQVINSGAEEEQARRWISRGYLKDIPASIKVIDTDDWTTTATGSAEATSGTTTAVDPNFVWSWSGYFEAGVHFETQYDGTPVPTTGWATRITVCGTCTVSGSFLAFFEGVVEGKRSYRLVTESEGTCQGEVFGPDGAKLDDFYISHNDAKSQWGS